MADRLHVPRSRIDVVTRGRDPPVLGRRTEARRREIRRRLGLDDDAPVVLAIGREEWQKGHDTLVDATARLVERWPDLTVLVAGRPGGRAGTSTRRSRAPGLTASVRVLGYRDDVADLLCGADVLAFPSRWEGLGSTLLEAMALEIPIVASDLPAVREVLTPDQALLVAPSDAIDARRRDRRVPRGTRRRPSTRRGRARRRFLEEFTAAAAARGMLDFYCRALDRGPAA